MITVKIHAKRGNDGAKELDKALRKLKKAMDKEGIVKELRERQYFEKPGEKKRKKSARARSRARRDERLRNSGKM